VDQTMGTYTLPRETFDVLEQSLGGKQRAEVLARTLETTIRDIQQKASEEILEQKQLLKIALKDELTRELVTRELFEERFKSFESAILEKFKLIDEKFSSIHFKLNIFIAIALIALTFANPTFVSLLEKLF
jgi:hypothetical protein